MHIKTQTCPPLPREEVIKAITRQHPARVPTILSHFWGEGLQNQYGTRLNELDRYPEDAAFLWITPLPVERFQDTMYSQRHEARDRAALLSDWSFLDDFIGRFPDPWTDPQFDRLAPLLEQYHRENRYILLAWWRLFFEKPWQIRGMENLLMDYHLAPEQVHRLHDALCTLYCGYIERAVREFDIDGFFTSDDLGQQTGPMMSPDLFKSFIKPYYNRLGDHLKRHDLHWWLHSCGDNTLLLPDLIQAGVDVFHPVQQGTMDAVDCVRRYGDRLAFLAGIDVQHILPEGDPDQVRQHVRSLIDIFDRPDGGLCLAAGNGIVSGTPFENIEAFLDEAWAYGSEHRRRFDGL